MSKNDDRILELKKQIETKKKSISEKKVRFIPETNCVLNMDGMTINLNVCSDDALLLLLIRLNSYGLKKEESDLKKMESKLDKLLSDDKKTELEIDEIAALLK